MVKEIKGIVKENPVMLERCCVFAVEQKNASYLVVSTEWQAGMDNIFVEQGQEISIRGSTIEDSTFKGVVLTEEAKIKIKEEKEG